MRCSELIERLQEQIDLYGDLDVEYASDMESSCSPRKLCCGIFYVVSYDDEGLPSEKPTHVYLA